MQIIIRHSVHHAHGGGVCPPFTQAEQTIKSAFIYFSREDIGREKARRGMFHHHKKNSKIIMKIALVLAATILFIFMYSHIHPLDADKGETQHHHRQPVQMNVIYYSFASILLLLMGLPILR